MRTYRATTFGAATVTDGKSVAALDPRLDVRIHSPTGFAWGYGGSGPAQLALAILIDHFTHHGMPEAEAIDYALRLYQHFKWAAIMSAPGDQPFALTTEQIEAYLRRLDTPYQAPAAVQDAVK